MRSLHAHVVLTALYLTSRALLYLAGVRLSFDLDWMWLADPADLRDRLAETLLYFHAFPPGTNAMAGLLLKAAGDTAASATHVLFLAFGVVFINAFYYLIRVVGFSAPAATVIALGFSLTPPSIYFEHLFHYEWPVMTLLVTSAVAFHRAVLRPTFGGWFAFFGLCAAIGATRSTFHLVWFAVLVGMATWLTGRKATRTVLTAAVIPGVLLVALYAKNLMLFGEFAASTFGPASLTLVTVNHLPPSVRDAWMAEGRLSPFASISVYAPPRDYARFFATPDHDRWPPQVTQLEHQAIDAANFNHWWLLEVHRARRNDVLQYLRVRPLAYLANAAAGLSEMFGPTTAWHPRDGTSQSPHYQHRQVLGGYERWYNRLLHSMPVAPVGLYALVAPLLIWAGVFSWQLIASRDPSSHARGALFVLLLFQIAYVVAASTMLTFLESSRYRFQIEWAIWVIVGMTLRELRTKNFSS